MELVLPSELVVDVQPPNLVRMAAASGDNEIPHFLTSVVMAEVHNLPDEVTHAPLRKKHLTKLSKFMDAVITGCLVWPRIVTAQPDVNAGEILISDLSAADRQYIFDWAMPADLDAVTTFARNRGALWEVYRMAQDYHQRPSTLVGIADAWLAWDFDKAVTALGRYCENEINAPTTNEGKRRQSEATNKLKRLLGVKNTNLITTTEQAIAMGFIPS